jgi:hypothetical protein
VKTFKSFYIEEKSKLDQLQAALDVAGFEPTVGTGADAVNTIISGLRAAAAKNTDQRKEHIINAGISAISMIPFADVIKLLKLRKLGRPATKIAAGGARGLKTFGKQQQASNRFGIQEKSIHDPVRPGILKRQVKGKMTCSKARTLKGKQKNKGNNTAKAAQRFLNYHC